MFHNGYHLETHVAEQGIYFQIVTVKGFLFQVPYIPKICRPKKV